MVETEGREGRGSMEVCSGVWSAVAVATAAARGYTDRHCQARQTRADRQTDRQAVRQIVYQKDSQTVRDRQREGKSE